MSSPIDVGKDQRSPDHPGALLSLLADDTRLRVFSAVVLGAESAKAVAERADVPVKAAKKALQRLVAGGVVVEDADGVLAAVPARLRAGARLAARMRFDPTPEDLGATPAQASVLRGYLVKGRLASLPSRPGKRRIVLDFVAQQFEPGRRYSEAEVNAILARVNDDYASLRRGLVDDGFLDRRDRVYWRSGGSFDVG